MIKTSTQREDFDIVNSHSIHYFFNICNFDICRCSFLIVNAQLVILFII